MVRANHGSNWLANMSDSRLPPTGVLHRLVASDWMPAAFAIAFYLQLYFKVDRWVPGAIEDELFAALLFAVMVLRFRSGVGTTAAPRRLLLASLPWLLAGLLSGLDAAAMPQWRSEMIRASSWLAMGAMLASLLATRGAVLNAAYGIAGAGAVVGALNTHQFLTECWDCRYLGLSDARFLNLHGPVDGYRATGTVPNPNYHAQFLLPLLAIAVERTWNARGRARLLAAVISTCLACGLALSYSRSAMLVMAVLVPVAVVGAARWRVSLSGLALTLVAAIAAMIVAGPALIGRAGTVAAIGDVREVASTPPDQYVDAALRDRLNENLAALQMLRDHPWNGVGAGGFSRSYREYAERIGRDSRFQRAAHSLYLEAAAESGIPGRCSTRATSTAFGVCGVSRWRSPRSSSTLSSCICPTGR